MKKIYREEIQERIRSVHALWREWLCSFGALTLVVILSFIISKVWLPLVVLGLAWLLFYYVSRMRDEGVLRCIRVTSTTAGSLVLSSVIMGICLLVNKTNLFASLFEPGTLNSRIPYIVSLIVFPDAAVMAGIALGRLGSSQECSRCKTRMGYHINDDMGDNIFHKEAAFQLKLLMIVSLAIGILNWVYYLGWYSNASLNGRDKYFYLVIPVVVYVITLFYTGRRYARVIDEMRMRYARFSHAGGETTLRFLVLRGDTLLLNQTDGTENPTGVVLDTPVTATESYTTEVDEKRARDICTRKLGTGDFELKYLYTTDQAELGENIVHYAVLLDGEEKLPEGWLASGEWYTIGQIDALMKGRMVSHTLAAEIHRIYTIVMAWKTYSRDGRRLYPIKNYVPTFRLRDFGEWNVDYGDDEWIYIAHHNQDKPLYCLRRAFMGMLGLFRKTEHE